MNLMKTQEKLKKAEMKRNIKSMVAKETARVVESRKKLNKKQGN